MREERKRRRSQDPTVGAFTVVGPVTFVDLCPDSGFPRRGSIWVGSYLHSREIMPSDLSAALGATRGMPVADMVEVLADALATSHAAAVLVVRLDAEHSSEWTTPGGGISRLETTRLNDAFMLDVRAAERAIDRLCARMG